MSTEKQLKEWLDGKPLHNKERDECCPDFSCCNGKIAPIETRKRFVKAIEDNDEKTKMEMLGMFLGSAFENVYVAGLEIPEQEH